MKRRAFTLLEALIAVAMIGLLAGALAIFVDDLATTRAHVTRTTDRARSADAVFGVVETALQTAVVEVWDDAGQRRAALAQALGDSSTARPRLAVLRQLVKDASGAPEAPVAPRPEFKKPAGAKP